MISVRNLSKSFGTQLLFSDVTFSVMPGDRVGLVGRNGHGKTTLFRVITGAESADGGEVTVSKGYRIAHMSQEPRFTRATPVDDVCTVPRDEEESQRWKAEKVLSGLGFSEADMTRPVEEFSGGFRMRINLAKTLIEEADLLLLDEPTNFLDIVSIRWLERFLEGRRGELMLITHDRTFMDRVTTQIMGIHRTRLRKVRGDTQTYYDQIAQEEQVHESRRINQENKRKQMEEFISKFRAKARQANLAQSRMKTLEKTQNLEKLAPVDTLSFSFNTHASSARNMLHVKDLRFSYSGTEPWLIDGLSLTVENRDRICVVGKNGKGKSTLLKLLAGEVAPVDGRIERHPATASAYYGQAGVAGLRDDAAVMDEIASANPEMDRTRIRSICGAMMFSGDDALKRINYLSGGEKSRVLLGKLLAAPANLLLLDEPTHHLDLESIEALIRAVEHFPGAAIIVTHDERLLHRLASRFVVFRDGRAFPLYGSYDDLLARYPWEEDGAQSMSGASTEQSAASGGGKTGKKELRRQRAALTRMRSERLNPLSRRIEELQQRIESLECDYHRDTETVVALSAEGEGRELAEVSRRMKRQEREIEALYMKLDQYLQRHEMVREELEKQEAEMLDRDT